MSPEENTIQLPGQDPDPEDKVKGYVKVGWSLVGAFFSLSILGIVLAILGIDVIPSVRSAYDYARLIAFIVTLMNIGAWMYFPLVDLSLQRRWIRTSVRHLPAGTSEFFAILLALVLLLATIISSLLSPLALAIAGFGVYVWNVVGFSYIRGQLRRVVEETRGIYSKHEDPKRTALLGGLSIVEKYFCIQATTHSLKNRQQTRHLLLALGFLISIALAVCGTTFGNVTLSVLSYLWSASVFLAAEISIAIWRSQRDRMIEKVEEDWRRAREGTC